MIAKRWFAASFLLCGVLLLPRLALAHAMLVSSTPAAHATVHGPDVAIELRYNSRVDGQRSTLTLVLANGSTQGLKLDPQGSATMLRAHATLEPGGYTLRWQALSTDGHITRGEIPFSVQ